MRTLFRLLLSLTVSAPIAPAADTGGVPAVPDSVPKDALRYSVLSSGNLAGNQVVWKSADGRRHALYQYNDRGRGPRIDTVTTVGTDGIPTSTENTGVDYLKGPVEERFTIFLYAFQLRKEICQKLHVPLVDGLELFELRL